MKFVMQTATLVALGIMSTCVAHAADRSEFTLDDQPESTADRSEFTLDDQPESTADPNKPFDGFYMGAQFGLDRMSAKILNNSGVSNVDDSDFTYEALIGYRRELSNGWVIGVEGTLGDRTGELIYESVEIEFDRIWSLSVSGGKRVGKNNDQLVYAKFGVGGIELDVNAHGNFVLEQKFEGPVSAIGYEFRLSKKLSFRSELRYVSYDPNLDHWQSKFGLLGKF